MEDEGEIITPQPTKVILDVDKIKEELVEELKKKSEMISIKDSKNGREIELMSTSKTFDELLNSAWIIHNNFFSQTKNNGRPLGV